MTRTVLNLFGWLFFIAAAVVLWIACESMNFVLVVPIVVLGIIACVFWGIRDMSRPHKVQPKVEPVNAKPKYKINGVLKNPNQVPVEYEFRPTFLLDESTGEIVETQVKHRKLPVFDAGRPGGVRFE